VNSDSNSTTLNPWSFNNRVNMLYIDQPVQVGFSYDTLVNATFSLTGISNGMTGFVTPNGTANETEIPGTFPSQSLQGTSNTTRNAARVLWHFMQVWLQEFPEYHTSDERVSVWGNSVSKH
jgi:hypothetical protein